MKTTQLIILAMLLAGCATTPEGELTDGSKTALVLGSVALVGAAVIIATQDDGGGQGNPNSCYIALGPGNRSERICR